MKYEIDQLDSFKLQKHIDGFDKDNLSVVDFHYEALKSDIAYASVKENLSQSKKIIIFFSLTVRICSSMIPSTKGDPIGLKRE